MTGSHVELLTYPACPASQAERDSWFGASGAYTQEEESAGLSSDTFEERLADEKRRSFESGREHGQAEEREAERQAQAAAQTTAHVRSAGQIGELIAKFAEERDRYLRAVEHEVVKLALAVAARILRREAQMDPLLLTGAVRVALGQLAGTTEVRLLVPGAELDLWSDAIAHLPNLPVKPAVRAGEGMRTGDCILETGLGSVDIGIQSQLAEIERGFFDRTQTSTVRKPDEPSTAGKPS